METTGPQGVQHCTGTQQTRTQQHCRAQRQLNIRSIHLAAQAASAASNTIAVRAAVINPTRRTMFIDLQFQEKRNVEYLGIGQPAFNTIFYLIPAAHAIHPNGIDIKQPLQYLAQTFLANGSAPK
jgi:hypothetical protein